MVNYFFSALRFFLFGVIVLTTLAMRSDIIDGVEMSCKVTDDDSKVVIQNAAVVLIGEDGNTEMIPTNEKG